MYILSTGLGIGNKIVEARRYYSTSSDPKKNSGSERKKKKPTIKSSIARPYPNLYDGRGKPQIVPDWVKDNGMERSPFGASWAKDKKDRIPLPSKYPCNYYNIKDPFNNRDLIKKFCRGNRVVYIWTHLPTGICLVGSSSSSIDRILSYFTKKYLFLDFRRGVQFLADWGFKDIQLTIIYFPYREYTTRDIKIIEAYYITELNSVLNTQKFVFLPDESESKLPLKRTNHGVHVYVYGPDKKRVLYIFYSKTAFYDEFGGRHDTLNWLLDLDTKLYDYFTFTSSPLEGSDFDNLLSMDELLDQKLKVNPKTRKKIAVKLIDLTNNMEYEFASITKAMDFLKTTGDNSTRDHITDHLKKNTVHRKRWIIKEL